MIRITQLTSKAIIIFVVLSQFLFAQKWDRPTGEDEPTSRTAKVGFVGAQFLKIEVGARGFALGNAIDPTVDDASAVFWNPAGLTLSSGRNLFTAKTSWLAGIDHIAVAFSMKLPGVPGYIAASYVGLQSGEMPVTTLEDPDGSISGQTFNAVNSAYGLGYAIKLTDKFNFGAHAKLISEDYANGLAGVGNDYGAGMTWGVDVGLLYLSGYKTIRIGMSIRNFGPEMQLGGKYWDYSMGDTLMTDEGFPEDLNFKPHGLPLTFRFGLAADPIDNPITKLTVSIVGEHPADNYERVNTGAELVFMKFFVGRAGYVFNHDTRGGSIGFGINGFPIANVGRINADFAITEFALFDPVWMASFGIQF